MIFANHPGLSNHHQAKRQVQGAYAHIHKDMTTSRSLLRKLWRNPGSKTTCTKCRRCRRCSKNTNEEIARSPATDPLRQVAFCPGTLRPATSRYVRRTGRPRNEWAAMLERESYKISPQAGQMIHNVADWKDAVQRHCSL